MASNAPDHPRVVRWAVLFTPPKKTNKNPQLFRSCFQPPTAGGITVPLQPRRPLKHRSYYSPHKKKKHKTFIWGGEGAASSPICMPPPARRGEELKPWGRAAGQNGVPEAARGVPGCVPGALAPPGRLRGRSPRPSMAQQETYGNWLGPPPLPAKRLVRQAGKNWGENTFIPGGFGGGGCPSEAGGRRVAQEGSAGGGSGVKGVRMRGVTRVPLS